MLTTVQPFAFASSERLVELADVRLAVVGELALGVVVVDEQAEARAAAGRVSIRSICRSPSELPNAADRAAADVRLMPTGLPALSSMKSTSGSLHQHRLAVAHLELRLAAAADDLLGRDAVDLLRPRAHELDAAAGDDEGLEAVRAQVGEQLEHRLIDHLGVEAA